MTRAYHRRAKFMVILMLTTVTLQGFGATGVKGHLEGSSSNSALTQNSVRVDTTSQTDPEVKLKPSDTDTASANGPTRSNSTDDALTAEIEFKKKLTHFLSQPVINQHDFDFTHNPIHACAVSTPLEVLFVIPSAPGNSGKRDRVRKGPIGAYISDPSNNAKMLFFTGTPECCDVWALQQAHIDDEFRNHGDIVQENFLDVYKNIRLKAVSMLRWAVTNCKRATYVIRTDDDVVVNVAEIVSVMRRKSREHAEFVIGVVKDDWKPARKRGKYHMPVQEYPDPAYPPFALGGLLGYPLTSVSLLYQAALRVKPIWLDDVYITGICARKVGVTLLRDPKFTFIHAKPEK